MHVCFLVFIGSGLGGVFRYLLSPAVQRIFPAWIFPFGTLSVNMLGCLLIGFLAQISELHGFLSPEARAFLLIGLIGGFTTFSSFAYETIQLMLSGQYVYAVANVSLQIVAGLTCVGLGYFLAKLI